VNRPFRRPLIRRRTRDRWLSLLSGGAYLALAAVAARNPQRWERRTFPRINHNGGTLSALRLPQQMGTPWMLPSIGLFGFWTHRPHLAVSGLLALPMEKSLEVGVKKLSKRRRPSQAQPEQTTLRDDAPADGPSYPSGHAAIAFCVVVLTAPYVPAAVTALLAGTATLTSFTRVHQGAHYPLDAVGGALLGVSVGSGLTFVFGLPEDSVAALTRWR